MARAKSNPRRSRRGGGWASSPSSLHSGVTSAAAGNAHELRFSSYCFFFGGNDNRAPLVSKILAARFALTLCFSLGTEEHLENLTVGSRGPELWRKFDIIRKPANLLLLGFLLHAWYAYSLVFPFFFPSYWIFAQTFRRSIGDFLRTCPVFWEVHLATECS